MPRGRRAQADVEADQEKVLAEIRAGAPTLAAAYSRAGIPYHRNTNWHYHDTFDWKRKRAEAQEEGRANAAREKAPVPDLQTFRKQCFGHVTFPHQQEWADALEQRRSLILAPPEMGKTTFLEEYCVWRIARDRTINIVFLSKTDVVAKKRVRRIAKLLTDAGWYRSQGFLSVPETWGPFRPEASRAKDPWSSTQLYVSGVDIRDRDPTVEALGITSQIQGARANLAILDDVATLKNQQSQVVKENILDAISQEITTRLGDTGQLAIIGTRVGEQDIYSAFLEGGLPWLEGYHTVVQPMITDEETREVLCPQMWPWDAVQRRRDETSPRTWSLVYQQMSTGMPGAPFREEAMGLPSHQGGCRDDSYQIGQRLDGLITVMGVDPALSGVSASVVVGFNAGTGHRFLIWEEANKGMFDPETIKQWIVQVAARFGVVECRVEKNAAQGFLSRDHDLRARLASTGCHLEEQHSGDNKLDDDWGIYSVASRFDTGMYHLPAQGLSWDRLRPFREELAAWRPLGHLAAKKGPRQDRVMALWLADLSVRKYETYGPLRKVRNLAPDFVRDTKERAQAREWLADRSLVR